MARPKAKVDRQVVERLAGIGATAGEIASVCGVSRSTLNARFQDTLKKGRANVKMSLRRWQLNAAEKGNPALLIFLGKVLLGQKEPKADDPPPLALVSDTIRWPRPGNCWRTTRTISSLCEQRRREMAELIVPLLAMAVRGDYALTPEARVELCVILVGVADCQLMEQHLQNCQVSAGGEDMCLPAMRHLWTKACADEAARQAE